MELTFLGRGAGFNPAEGSTSAYFIDNGELFLIDCGESVFRVLLERKILDSVSAVNLFITHTHSDHCGGLGSLILYANIVKKIKPNFVFDKNTEYLSDVRALLGIFGITAAMYSLADASDYNGRCSLFNKVRYVKTGHSKDLAACAIIFETKQGIVFYSGDTNDSAPLLEIINSGSKIDKIYMDSCNDRDNTHHLSIYTLNDIIPSELKPRTYCMHFNNSRCMEEAGNFGFQIVACQPPIS
jgi:ribonuclease BN (tRNA processing enzyme)